MDTLTASEPASRLWKVDWAGVGLFVGLTFALTWAIELGFWVLHLSAGVPKAMALGVSAMLAMYVPGLVCLLLRGPLRHEGFADAGLKVMGPQGHRAMYGAAYLLVPAWIVASIAIALIVGRQHWDPGHGIRLIAAAIANSPSSSLPMPPEQLARIVYYGELVLAFTLAIAINSLFTFGEELGWRGYLLPRLAPLGGPRAAALTGAIWGFWHAPIIFLYSFDYPHHPFWGVPMFVVWTMLIGFFFAWLRFRSGSIWPGVLAHAAINAQSGLAIAVLTTGDSLIAPPTGVISMIPMALFAIWLSATRRLTPDNEEISKKGLTN